MATAKDGLGSLISKKKFKLKGLPSPADRYQTLHSY